MSDAQSSTGVRIPLWGTSGTVRAYVLVDEADAEWARQYRWALSSAGYAYRSLSRPLSRNLFNQERVTYFMHRELMGLVRKDGKMVDHINRHVLDNRRRNLRLASCAEQSHNQSPINNRGYSRYRGVRRSARDGKWMAYANVDHKSHYLGRFNTEEEAAYAAKSFRAQYMPYSPDARQFKEDT